MPKKFIKKQNTRVNKNGSVNPSVVPVLPLLDDRAKRLLQIAIEACEKLPGESAGLIGVIHNKTGVISLATAIPQTERRAPNYKVKFTPDELPPLTCVSVGPPDEQIVHLDTRPGKLDCLDITLQSYALQDIHNQNGRPTSHCQCIVANDHQIPLSVTKASDYSGFTLIVSCNPDGEIQLCVDGKSISLNAVLPAINTIASAFEAFEDGKPLEIEHMKAIKTLVGKNLKKGSAFLHLSSAKAILESAIQSCRLHDISMHTIPSALPRHPEQTPEPVAPLTSLKKSCSQRFFSAPSSNSIADKVRKVFTVQQDQSMKRVKESNSTSAYQENRLYLPKNRTEDLLTILDDIDSIDDLRLFRKTLGEIKTGLVSGENTATRYLTAEDTLMTAQEKSSYTASEVDNALEKILNAYSEKEKELSKTVESGL